MTTPGDTPDYELEPTLYELRPPPIVENYEQIKELKAAFERELLTGALPIDAMFGPDTCDIHKRTRKILKKEDANEKRKRKKEACIYLVYRKLGRKERRKYESEGREEDLRKQLLENDIEPLDWSSSSLEAMEEENIEDYSTTNHFSRISFLGMRQTRPLTFKGSSLTDKHYQRATRILCPKSIVSSNSQVQNPAFMQAEREPFGRRSVQTSCPEDFLDAMKTNWEATDLLQLSTKVGMNRTAEKACEGVKQIVDSFETDCDKFMKALRRKDSEEEDYARESDAKAKVMEEQKEPESEVLNAFSQAISNKAQQKDMTKALISKFKEVGIIRDEEIEKMAAESRVKTKNTINKYIAKTKRPKVPEKDDKAVKGESEIQKLKDSIVKIEEKSKAELEEIRPEFKQVPVEGEVLKKIPYLTSVYVPENE